MKRPRSWRERLAAVLVRHWYRDSPSVLSQAVMPLAWIYGALVARRRSPVRRAAGAAAPLVVVGNLIAGGAGKTPVVIALVEALRKAGWSPGVVSRGYGRRVSALKAVGDHATAGEVGDEPLLLWRRTQAPVYVAGDRRAAADALCRAHPGVDILISDDGLQNPDLHRDAEIIVFDERGAGNRRLLPAGPLREPMAKRPPDAALVLYNHSRPSTPWPGHCAVRALGNAVPLADWLDGRHATGQGLATLRGRRLLAVAGIAAPERFFAMLEAAGLTIDRLPLPDHHDYAEAPWPADTPDVVTTEKDAVKLTAFADGGSRIWVLPLDLQLPPAFITALLARLPPRRAP